MTRRLRHLLRGAGDLLVITPAAGYGRFRIRATPAERLGAHFRRVGDDLRAAIGRHAAGPGTRPPDVGA